MCFCMHPNMLVCVCCYEIHVVRDNGYTAVNKSSAKEKQIVNYESFLLCCNPFSSANVIIAVSPSLFLPMSLQTFRIQCGSSRIYYDGCGCHNWMERWGKTVVVVVVDNILFIHGIGLIIKTEFTTNFMYRSWK